MDEGFLDDLFEEACAALSEGRRFDASSWFERAPDRRKEIEQTLRLARAVAVRPNAELPTLAGYELIDEIGRGAMGTVWLARQLDLGGRLVALKILPRDALFSEERRQRFLQEAKALARVRHPNVVAVFDVVQDREVMAYAMEWIEGRSLAECISAHKGTPRADWLPFVARIGVQIARALEAVHEIGLVHRDVKPSNILIREDGTAMLGDFGLVRDPEQAVQTMTGAFVGTLAYAAPEQLRGDKVAAPCDIYGLGATLYQALGLRLPYDQSSPAELTSAIEAGTASALRRLDSSLPHDVDVIVQKAMSLEPEQRYASAVEMGDDLQRLLDLRPILARPTGLVGRLRKAARRNRRFVVAAGAGAALALLASIAIVWWFVHQAALPARAAAELRQARLALLDDRLAERSWNANATMAGASRRPRPLPAAKAAIAHYRAATALVEDAATDRERSVVAIAAAIGARRVFAPADVEALIESCPAALAAARAWREQGAIVPIANDELANAQAIDRRALGLLAYLCGDTRTALLAWRSASEDPLVDGLVGLQLLTEGEFGAAYPRLARAADAFAESGSLRAAAAVAALACREDAIAERWAREAGECERPARRFELTRLEAELAWARGDDREAERLFRKVRGVYLPATWRLGMLSEARGDYERVAGIYAARVALHANDIVAFRGLLRSSEAWWRSLDAAAKRRMLLDALDGEVRDFGSLFGVLHGLAKSHRMLSVRTQRESSARSPRVPRLADAQDAADLALLRDRSGITGVALRWFALEAYLPAVLDLEAEVKRRLADALLDPRRQAPALPKSPKLSASGDALWSVDAPVTIEALAAFDDHDGDGLRDVLVATRDQATRQASLTLVSSGKREALWERAGEQPGDNFGTSMASLGDLSGDGVAEVAVGACSGRYGNRGYVMLLDGRSGEPRLRIQATNDGGQFAFSIASLEDVDGDGARDLAVGSYRARGKADAAGRVDVFSSKGALLYTVLGEETEASLGLRLVGLGDVDGDGAGDFAASAPFYEGERPGYVAIISGKSGRVLRRVNGEKRGFGYYVAKIRDVDGDRIPELAITSTMEAHQTHAPIGHLLVVTPVSGKVLSKIGPVGHMYRMQPCGDLDGDGRDELAVVDWRRHVPRAATLRVYDLDGRVLLERRDARAILPLGRGATGAARVLFSDEPWRFESLVLWGAEIGRRLSITELELDASESSPRTPSQRR